MAAAGGSVPVTVAGGTASAAKALLDVLAAAPRPAGRAAEARARSVCADQLEALGFDVREEPFEYSALPGLYATPLGGAASMAALAAAGSLGSGGRPLAALALLAGIAALLAAAGVWAARRGVVDAPLLRRRGTNLVARRGVDATARDGTGASGRPAVWLVAHLDSKSQPVPIALRAGGIAASAALWLAAAAVAIAQLTGADVGDGAWRWVAALGIVAGAPVVASVVGSASPGALDNASGVATVLLAASALPRDVPLGVLLPSAEELGLAGARAWAREEGRGAGLAINCDGVDDSGVLTLMYTGRRPVRLLRAGERAGAAAGVRPRPRRLLPGILTDGVALADAGWEAVTVSKGALRTLARIHTPLDVSARLEGRGIAVAARVIAGMVGELMAELAAEPHRPRADAGRSRSRPPLPPTEVH